MSEDGTNLDLKAAFQVLQAAGALSGVPLTNIPGSYLLNGRTEEYRAEMIRLAREHGGMVAGMDRYADSRDDADGTAKELTLTENELAESLNYLSPLGAKPK